MKNRLLGLLAAGLIAAPMAGNAMPVTWRFDGSTTFTTGDFVSVLNVRPGDPFHFSLNFDTSAPLRFCDVAAGGGTFCRYNWDSIGFSKIFLGSQGPFNPAFLPGDTGTLFVRDNYPAPAGDPGGAVLVDGLSFGRDTSDSSGTVAHFSVLLRGPVLDILNGPGIPGVPDPRLAGLRLSDFGICLDSRGVAAFTCDVAEYHGDITSIVAIAAVPEPETYAIFALGLLLLAGARRWRAPLNLRRD